MIISPNSRDLGKGAAAAAPFRRRKKSQTVPTFEMEEEE